MNRIDTGLRRLARLRAGRQASQPHPPTVALTDEDRRYLTSLYDETTPLPPGAEQELVRDNPILVDLRRRYWAHQHPALSASRWSPEAVESFFDIRYFRGETLITWHYRELPRISKLKYFILAGYVSDRDSLKLLARMEEDGAFGCWTFSYPGYGRVSRDLLESINEINFLERSLHLKDYKSLRVLDIGAGYGRLAHRMTAALPQIDDYCCVDAIPESTFVSEYYLRHRGCDRARVAPLDRLDAELRPGWFDLALNIHSFSECTHDAVAWWISMVERLELPWLLIVPNEPDALLTLEPDGVRLDFLPLLEGAGYRLAIREPVVDDEAVRELLDLNDHFFLFQRRT